MRSKLPYKTKQFFFVAIKLAIVVGAIYFIYNKLTTNELLDYNSFVSALRNNGIFSINNMLILFCLSLGNFLLESLKWKQLVSFVSEISLNDALRHTLAGLTASQITPQRLGDYGAKILYFKSKLRPKIALLNLVGHLAQLLVTLMVGVVGLGFLIYNYQLDVNYYRILKFLVIFTSLLTITVFGLSRTRIRFKGYSVKTVWTFLKSLPVSLNLKCFAISMLRYALFSFQYYFLLHIFGIEIEYLVAMAFIASMYLIASLIPVINVFDVIIRGSVAVYLFSLLNIDPLTILCITTIMWLLNVVVPSLLGSYVVLNYKLPIAKT
ncbi:MAG: flippase-like domain-containing protein [Winogradskyella sp.]|nr:flippase-like domain-containing protein [Winogradskyella sp.]